MSDQLRSRRALSRRLRRFLTVSETTDGVVAAAPVVPIRAMFRRFWPYVRPDLPVLLLSLVFVVLTPLAAAASIWIFKHIIDSAIVPGRPSALWPLAAALVAITLAGGVVSYASSSISAWMAERFLLRLRGGVFDHLLGLSPSFFERHRAGDVVSRLTGDIGAIESLVLSGVTRTISYAARIAIFATLAFMLRWELALLAFVVAPLFWLVARHFSRQIKKASREKRRRSGGVSAVAEETLAHMPLVQAYGQERAESSRLHAEGLARLSAGLASNRMSSLYTPAVELVEMVGGLLVLGLGVWELSQGRLTVGGLLAFVAYLTQLYGPIRGASRLATTVYSASASAERLLEVLDSRPAVVSSPGALAAPRSRGAVGFDSVSFSYEGSSRPALDRLSLQIAPGEVVAVMGQNGAGKSTLTKLLMRWNDPSAGAVRLDGVDIRSYELASLRSQFAVVLQETMLFDRSVADNILYGVPGASRGAVLAAAQAAAVTDFAFDLPSGFDSSVGQRGRRLSGGQRQRVAIARALIRQAPVLILDEPTASLDASTTRKVVEPLRRLMNGRTTLLITHDRELMGYADRVVTLDGGRVVSDSRVRGLAS
ncbi:ABC transporter ATP-binding protein [Tenggerimyces flavus]|uniref:ABC transporter ATP-binding protein n=1 Tax=Tenggerimyces flavus TaxID=1708749 RepID=A0ABV7YNR6_9ACTN|nr:ABC transporter ATP-binding protein [Tenggerimyces flavus]MBM7784621.1 ABC-type multidrug transport system fused ATPase/permease subunit [Tenggerimyces flavus]